MTTRLAAGTGGGVALQFLGKELGGLLELGHIGRVEGHEQLVRLQAGARQVNF